MRTKTTIPVMTALCLSLVGARGATAQQNRPVWAVGQEWMFLVNQYGGGWRFASGRSRGNEQGLVPGVQYKFHVRARVTELTRRDGRECVRIKFTAEPDAPVVNWTHPPTADVFRAQEYTLTLDAQTWTAVGLDAKAEGPSSQVSRAEGCTALFAQAQCFPVDWVVARSDLENPTEHTELLNFPGFQPTPDRPSPMGALRRSVSPEKDGTLRITVGEVDLIPRKKSGEPPKEAMREVEQVWRPGELWWRSFRRFSGGHIDLEAVLVSDPGGSGKITAVPTRRPSAGPTKLAGPTWTVGDEWRFLVKLWGGEPDLPWKLQFEFHMKARVTELVKEEGRDCARIEFIAEDDAPGMLTALFTLVVDTQTWSPIRFEYPKKHGGVRGAAEAQGYRALLPTMPGVPLDWVILRSDLGSAAAREEFLHFPGLKSVAMFGFRRVISAPEKDGTLRITVGLWVPTQDPQDMTYESAKDAMCEVEQVWHPGELWWRSFRRLSHGRLELEATRVSEGVQP